MNNPNDPFIDDNQNKEIKPNTQQEQDETTTEYLDGEAPVTKDEPLENRADTENSFAGSPTDENADVSAQQEEPAPIASEQNAPQNGDSSSEDISAQQKSASTSEEPAQPNGAPNTPQNDDSPFAEHRTQGYTYSPPYVQQWQNNGQNPYNRPVPPNAQTPMYPPYHAQPNGNVNRQGFTPPPPPPNYPHPNDSVPSQEQPYGQPRQSQSQGQPYGQPTQPQGQQQGQPYSQPRQQQGYPQGQPYGQPNQPQGQPQGYPQGQSYGQPSQPQGQQPQAPYYYNGMWFSPAPAPPKKKMSKSGKWFMTVILIFTAVFLVGLIGNMVENAGKNPLDFSSYVRPTLPDQSSPDTPTMPNIDYSNPNGPSISFVEPPKNTTPSTKHAYKTLSPSVVSVMTYDNNTDTATLLGQGTGIILSTDGYIVTNSHVIDDSKNNYITVTLKDGEEYDAVTVGYDSRTDIAVLKIEGKDLQAAEFASSETLSVGEDVVAIGNPGGIDYSNSLTRGVVSALDRTVNQSTVLYIQTDAAINPGNSGGPLANLYGQVLGINTIKVVSPEYEGMGFAIPSMTIKEIADDLISQGYVSDRVRVGVTGTFITKESAANANIKSGILISDFSKDSPLPKERVQKEDIITAINGTEISSFPAFYRELEKHRAGDEITLTIYRMAENNHGKEKTFDVTIKLLRDNGDTQSSNNR